MLSDRPILLFGLLLAFGLPAVSGTEEEQELTTLEWPRTYSSAGNEVVLFQPQIESWTDHATITGKAAFALTLVGSKEPVYGAIEIEAKTETDLEERTVLFRDRKIPRVWFPNASPEEADRWEGIVRGAFPPAREMLVSLDRVVANFERSQHEQGSVEVNLEPPPIFRSETPAILVLFLGEPKFEAIEGTGLLFATNTNWDLFLEPASGTYYLLDGESWLTTTDVLKGPWGATTALPSDLSKLPKDDNWKNVRENLPGKGASTIPRVLTSTQPAELILTEGPPSLSPIPDTKLLWVTNTDSDLFLHTGTEPPSYYFLVAGRWFRSGSIDGPWKSAQKDLPEDFARIPEEHPRGRVLASVPGTPDAETAILMASIPRKAKVDRKTTKATVTYEGEPEFVEIEGTKTVYYAVNSPHDVFRVDGKYYCCQAGVWFVADGPKGPWEVATVIPSALYDIPASHPKHNVTYVYVYDSTPSKVVVGYTSGYTGAYVVYGALLFGAGYYYGHYHSHPHYYYHCHPHYYSYGCGARYDYYYGGYYRSAYAYGPYGGAGAWSAYNPATGTYSRGAYRYGPNGSAYARQAYNPYTGNYAGRVTGTNPYGSWGRSVVSDGQNWARGGHRSGARGTVGGIETSRGGKVVAGRRNDGSGGFAGKNRHGDVYVGKDGNIYKRNDNGSWQKRSNGSWSDYNPPRRNDRGTADRGTNRTGRTGDRSRTSPRSGTGTGRERAGTGSRGNSPSSRSRATSSQRGGVKSGLNRASKSRSRGNSRATRARSSGSRSRGMGRGSRGGARGGRRR